MCCTCWYIHSKVIACLSRQLETFIRLVKTCLPLLWVERLFKLPGITGMSSKYLQIPSTQYFHVLTLTEPPRSTGSPNQDKNLEDKSSVHPFGEPWLLLLGVNIGNQYYGIHMISRWSTIVLRITRNIVVIQIAVSKFYLFESVYVSVLNL